AGGEAGSAAELEDRGGYGLAASGSLLVGAVEDRWSDGGCAVSSSGSAAEGGSDSRECGRAGAEDRNHGGRIGSHFGVGIGSGGFRVGAGEWRASRCDGAAAGGSEDGRCRVACGEGGWDGVGGAAADRAAGCGGTTEDRGGESIGAARSGGG